MIGPGLKKLARENGMSVASGVAYGDFRGYAATFSEGSGYKLIAVTTKFPDEQAENSFMDELHRRDLKKEFRVQELIVSDNSIVVNFHDSIDTMKYISSFCDFFFPLLAQYGASGVNVCPECGGEFFGDGRWKLINGAAYHLHESCASSIAAGAAAQEQAARDADTGTVGAGIIGALLGALRVHCPFHSMLTRSSDGGRTWSAPEMLAAGSPPHLLRHSSGAVVVTYGYRQAPFGQRARVSLDDGRTWGEELTLRDDGVSGDLGYPSSVELSDGSILTVYYQALPGGGNCALLGTVWEL